MHSNIVRDVWEERWWWLWWADGWCSSPVVVVVRSVTWVVTTYQICRLNFEHELLLLEILQKSTRRLAARTK